MRTTVTLEPDVAKLLDEAVHRERRPFKAVLNDALRRGLTVSEPPRADERFEIVPHHATLMPGWDPAGFNRLADDLEDESLLRDASHR
jgi:hypothetical protein